MIATDAGSEGLNLQGTCRLVVNLELPWTPTRLEQRVAGGDGADAAQQVEAAAVGQADVADEYLEWGRRGCLEQPAAGEVPARLERRQGPTPVHEQGAGPGEELGEVDPHRTPVEQPAEHDRGGDAQGHADQRGIVAAAHLEPLGPVLARLDADLVEIWRVEFHGHCRLCGLRILTFKP